MQAVFLGLFAALIVAADQITKYLTVMNILPSAKTELVGRLVEAYGMTGEQLVGLPSKVDAIPGVFSFVHVLNEGAAWSSFSGMQWLFALIFVLFTVAVVWEYRKRFMGFTTFEWWCIAAIYGGGLGNMIDRLRMGFVVDMIQLEFMNFPVFNVADCFISCGCIALIVHMVFFNKTFWKDGKQQK